MKKGCRLFKLGEATGFICGGEITDHKCNSDSGIILLPDGKRVEDTEENKLRYKKEAVGWSAVCSICGRAAIDDAPYF